MIYFWIGFITLIVLFLFGLALGKTGYENEDNWPW
jgi:hypothetical protein